MLSNITKWLNGKKKAHIYYKNNPFWTTSNWTNFEKVYRSNSIVYFCINLISSCVARVPLKNKIGNFHHIIEQIVQSILIYGNCFIYKKDEKFEILPINSIKSIYFNNQGLKEYLFEDRYNTIIYDESEIIHFKNSFSNTSNIQGSNNFYGLSSIEVIMKLVDLYDSVLNYSCGVLQTGGRGSGILSHDEEFSQLDKDRLKKDFSKLYNDADTHGRVILIEGNYKWQSIGYDPDKLNIENKWNKIPQEIAMVFGVPISMISKDERSIYNKATRQYFWEDTIIPFCRKIYNELESSLNIEIDMNLEEIEALDETRNSYWNRIKDVLTENEKREFFNLNKVNNE